MTTEEIKEWYSSLPQAKKSELQHFNKLTYKEKINRIWFENCTIEEQLEITNKITNELTCQFHEDLDGYIIEVIDKLGDKLQTNDWSITLSQGVEIY